MHTQRYTSLTAENPGRAQPELPETRYLGRSVIIFYAGTMHAAANDIDQPPPVTGNLTPRPHPVWPP